MLACVAGWGYAFTRDHREDALPRPCGLPCFLPSPGDGVMTPVYVDDHAFPNTRAREDLGWAPRTALRERTRAWARDAGLIGP